MAVMPAGHAPACVEVLERAFQGPAMRSRRPNASSELAATAEGRLWLSACHVHTHNDTGVGTDGAQQMEAGVPQTLTPQLAHFLLQLNADKLAGALVPRAAASSKEGAAGAADAERPKGACARGEVREGLSGRTAAPTPARRWPVLIGSI